MADGGAGLRAIEQHEVCDDLDVDGGLLQVGGRKAEREKMRQYYVGIALLLAVVVLWTSSSFLTQDLLGDGFDKPFLITYLNTSSFALYLLPWFFRRYRARKDNNIPDTLRHGYEAIAADALEAPTSTLRSNFRAASIMLEDHHSFHAKTDDLAPLTTRETARLASEFCFFWFIANWSVNASLDYTTVGSSTILASMSGFFTLGIGRLFRIETFTLAKVAAVATSFTGVVLVSLSDSAAPPSHSDPPIHPNHLNLLADLGPIAGDALALLSAFFYALYVTLLKVRIKEESRVDMQLFFGFVGLFNVMLLWPVGLVLHFTGVEPLEWPSGGKAWGAVVVNMAITLSSDFIYVLAMLKTTPLVVTVGLSLTIPLAIVGDLLMGVPAAGRAVLGGMLVVGSFVVVGMEDSRQEQGQDVRVVDGLGVLADAGVGVRHGHAHGFDEGDGGDDGHGHGDVHGDGDGDIDEDGDIDGDEVDLHPEPAETPHSRSHSHGQAHVVHAQSQVKGKTQVQQVDDIDIEEADFPTPVSPKSSSHGFAVAVAVPTGSRE